MHVVLIYKSILRIVMDWTTLFKIFLLYYKICLILEVQQSLLSFQILTTFWFMEINILSDLKHSILTKMQQKKKKKKINIR